MLPSVESRGVIVVCEDDEATLELLCDHLRADRFDAIPAPSASDALRQCQYRSPDMLLLDLGLPDASGLDVLREIRGSEGATGRFDPGLPVIILSGRSSEADRVRGFEGGADDFVVKPYYAMELTARVGAVLGRRSEERAGPIRLGDLVIDPSQRHVRVDGEKVELSNKEYELLLALARDPRRVFTKTELLRDVWSFEVPGRTRTLDSHASRLRRKLDPEGRRYVSNCWGIPFRRLSSSST